MQLQITLINIDRYIPLRLCYGCVTALVASVNCSDDDYDDDDEYGDYDDDDDDDDYDKDDDDDACLDYCDDGNSSVGFCSSDICSFSML